MNFNFVVLLMKFILLFVILYQLAETMTAMVLDDYWKYYKQSFGKVYTSAQDDKKHQVAFLTSVKFIINHNAVNFTLGLNKFADEPLKEFKLKHTSYKSAKPAKILTRMKSAAGFGGRIDWRDYGFITRVRDQGKCGACYSIATVGSLEGVYSRVYHSPVEFSIQELIDCSDNDGCDGGWLGTSFQYIVDKHTQWPDLDAEYQFTGVARDCDLPDRESFHDLRCIGYLSLESGDEREIYNALQQTPVPAAIVTTMETVLYESGVIEGICSDKSLEPDHAVLIVGYDVDSRGGFWIIKNSWGGDWGENGYFRLRAGANECKIASDNVVPIIAKYK